MRYFYAKFGIMAAMLTPGMLAAQSADASATIEVVPAGNTVVTKTADLNFGSHPACNPPATCDVRSSDVGAAAAWNIGFNQVGNYGVTFTLPSALSSATGAQVPLSFGATAASSPFLVPSTWNPASPVTIGVGAAGQSLDISLGADLLGVGTGDVTVSLAGAAPGTYQGVITLTVAAL